MELFGVIRHSPDELIRALLDKFTKPSYYYNSYGTNLPIDGVKEKFILIPAITDFRRFYSLLNTKPYENKYVFVFSSEVLLIEYENLIFLDGNKTSDIEVEPLDYMKLELVPKKSKIRKTVARSQNKFVDSMIELTHSQSVFNDLMTFIYKLPAKTHQKPIKVVCCRWLRSNASENVLRKRLSELRATINISEKVEDTIVKLLNVPAAERMRKAFVENPNINPMDVAEIAEKYDIHSFELSYILNVLSNEKDYATNKKKSIDERMVKQ